MHNGCSIRMKRYPFHHKKNQPAPHACAERQYKQQRLDIATKLKSQTCSRPFGITPSLPHQTQYKCKPGLGLCSIDVGLHCSWKLTRMLSWNGTVVHPSVGWGARWVGDAVQSSGVADLMISPSSFRHRCSRRCRSRSRWVVRLRCSPQACGMLCHASA